MEKILLTLSEFIEKTEKELPCPMTMSETLNSVLDKYQAICKYNRFLQQDLTTAMFEGDNRIFEGGQHVNVQPSTQWNYYEIAGVKVFQDGNHVKNLSIGKTVGDIAGKGIKMCAPPQYLESASHY